ncbi:uncharacterized protein BDR25DRAFT_331654 [Lindgomyces ingoldianus]|uniref:Uncharacterized protein n=1 Tax=Lindgomyces ingoldianus TaxID=673940 RepID=A0ACB6RCL9_9PLEO|nr:uncharacterized protein BDR25DRAFT_331654 [Lindgomyces ingoldianus]KAF2476075.1 hypothetical protein BDR25DRAFT_331654 [Lindgomyces ingoldianus]
MATATQLMPSPTQALKSAFSPYTDSPSSPANFAHVFSNRSSGTTSDHLVPPPSPYPSTVDPSPVDSNGTNATEIEDDAQVNQVSEDEMSDMRSPDMEDIASPASQASQDSQAKPSKLDTAIPPRTRADSDDAPQSVIHAPTSFKTFNRVSVSAAGSNETRSDSTAVVSPQTPEANMIPDEKHASATSAYTYPLDTDLPPAGPEERTTPRAQTRQEVEDGSKRRSRVSLSLADIAETDDYNTVSDASSTFQDDGSAASQSQQNGSPPISMSTQTMATQTMGAQTMGEALQNINEAEREVAALRDALGECWTLCNTLAKLSQNHRQRMFHYSGGRGDVQEHAWRSCWRLCQKLYESRNEDHASQVKPTLELCRDFCQALFEVRQRGDEAADSVLRVSFELNNHLYNAHDRALPEAFRERTLDFYLTLCHRLMKQRTSLPEETDALLHACWSLAEMLFSIRQNSRDGKPADEELLGSAIQACWELCDLFREGWTQVRPERGTPRPSQYTFPAPASVSQSQSSYSERSGRSSSLNESYHSAISMRRQLVMHPETPTTIFDDREEFSPSEEPNVPNILILGPEAGATRTHDRWSSAASSLSTYSDASQSVHTSSTATAGREDPNLIRLKGLIVKSAINTGYSRQTPLPDFVRALPSNSFGTIPWQSKLFEHYKKLVLSDPTLRTVHTTPLRRLTASEIGRAVQWMARSEQFSWMRDLYRFVFGSFPEDAGQRNLIINA